MAIPSDKPPVLVSRCLLGERVRYDGRLQGHPFVMGALAELACLVPVCPEVEAGLGVPRPPIQLVEDGSEIRVVVVHSREDISRQLLTWLAARLPDLVGKRPVAAVLKSRSPSCGVGSTPIHDETGRAIAMGSGFFAQRLAEIVPGLPCFQEDELEERRQELVELLCGGP